MDARARTLAEGKPISDELGGRILEPFCQGLDVALRDLAQTESVRLSSCQLDTRLTLGELRAGLELVPIGLLTLGFSYATATSLAQRMLHEAEPRPDLALVQDCAGELANIVAGQAKALLFGTPYHFAFQPPNNAAMFEFSTPTAHRCLAAVLGSDVGEIVIQLFLTF